MLEQTSKQKIEDCFPDLSVILVMHTYSLVQLSDDLLIGTVNNLDNFLVRQKIDALTFEI